jgi:hypothetical protein
VFRLQHCGSLANWATVYRVYVCVCVGGEGGLSNIHSRQVFPLNCVCIPINLDHFLFGLFCLITATADGNCYIWPHSATHKLCRTLDEGSARRRTFTFTTHNTQNRHPFPSRDSNLQSQHPQTYVLQHAATGICLHPFTVFKIGHGCTITHMYLIDNVNDTWRCRSVSSTLTIRAEGPAGVMLSPRQCKAIIVALLSHSEIGMKGTTSV